jgi:hypothetical protein
MSFYRSIRFCEFISISSLVFCILATAFPITASSHEFDEPINASATAKFLIPNEADNWLNLRDVSADPGIKPRVAISVGSVRAFNLAVLADHALVVDYSDGLIGFDKILAEMVLRYNRSEFLAAVSGAPSKFMISTREDFLRAIAAQRETGAQPKGSEPLTEQFMSFFPDLGERGQSFWLGWLLAMRNYAQSDLRWNWTFFGSDESYDHVRKMIREGRFHLVRGSLSGNFSMSEISKWMRREGIILGAIDVSNAIEHIANLQGAAGIERFQQNLSQLPIDRDSQILLTVDLKKTENGTALPESSKVGNWFFYARPIAKILDLLTGIQSNDEFNLRLAVSTKAPACRTILNNNNMN